MEAMSADCGSTLQKSIKQWALWGFLLSIVPLLSELPNDRGKFYRLSYIGRQRVS
jgi:hypothetical protein